MRNSDFFQEIAHVDVLWGDMTLSVPLFYYDIGAIGVGYLTPLDNIRKLLPSPRMHPLRVTPWHGITTINAYEYRNCDIGPYNKVAIGFPITNRETRFSLALPQGKCKKKTGFWNRG
jgi:hypothetical protein